MFVPQTRPLALEFDFELAPHMHHLNRHSSLLDSEKSKSVCNILHKMIALLDKDEIRGYECKFWEHMFHYCSSFENHHYVFKKLLLEGS